MPESMHLKLSTEEMERLWQRIEEDLATGDLDHQARMRRWALYLKSWRRKQPETDIDIERF